MPAPKPPQRPHHINFEVERVMGVALAWERALARRTRMAGTLGQHANDRMVFFYSASPDGWLVDIGAPSKVVHEGWTGQRECDRIREWGHQRPQLLGDLLLACGS